MHEKTQAISRFHVYNAVKVCAHINKDYEVPCESEKSYRDDDKNYL